jgi:hypothetical protein
VRAVTGAVDRWMFGAYRAAPADLALYRILYAGFVLLAVVPAALWVDGAPRAFFNPPPGPAALAAAFPPAGTLLALNLLLVLLLGLLLVGWRTAPVSVATGAVLLAIKCWEYADGKINHDILLVLIPLLLAGSGWGRALSVDARRAAAPHPLRAEGSWPLALTAFVIGLSMFGAGALKLMTGWLDPATHSTYGHLIINNMGAGRSTWLSSHVLGWNAPLMWEAADWTAALLEAAFVLAMLRQRALHVALALICWFHLGVWLLFDIVFSANVMAYGAFVAWAPLLARWPAVRSALVTGWTPSRRTTVLMLGGAWAVGLAGVAVGVPLEHRLGMQLQELVLIAGALGGTAYLARAVLGRRRAPAPVAGAA